MHLLTDIKFMQNFISKLKVRNSDCGDVGSSHFVLCSKQSAYSTSFTSKWHCLLSFLLTLQILVVVTKQLDICRRKMQIFFYLRLGTSKSVFPNNYLSLNEKEKRNRGEWTYQGRYPDLRNIHIRTDTDKSPPHSDMLLWMDNCAVPSDTHQYLQNGVSMC